MEEEWSAQLREALFSAQVLHYPGQFNQRQSSRYLLRYSQDIKSAQQLISQGWIDLVRQLMVVSSGLALMWWLYPPFGSFALTIILFATSIFIGCSMLTKKALHKSRSKQSALLAFVAKQFKQYEWLQSSGKAAQATQRFQRRSQALLLAKKQLRYQEALLQASAAVVPAALLLLFFSLAWQWGGLSYAHAMMLVLLIMQWQSPIRKLLRIPGILQKGNVSLQKMKEQWHRPNKNDTQFTTIKQSSPHTALASESPVKCA
jgi:ABC-type multidrug transport system fused ATPase/permease subunit